VTFVRLNLMLQNVGADAHGAGTQAVSVRKMAKVRAMAIIAPMNNRAIGVPTLSRVSPAASAREQSS